jgi:hypothetical protein
MPRQVLDADGNAAIDHGSAGGSAAGSSRSFHELEKIDGAGPWPADPPEPPPAAP